jgi:hypothetical protein
VPPGPYLLNMSKTVSEQMTIVPPASCSRGELERIVYKFDSKLCRDVQNLVQVNKDFGLCSFQADSMTSPSSSTAVLARG